MKTLRLAFTLVLLSLMWDKACGRVGSCLHCFSGPGHEDPECAEGTGKGSQDWELTPKPRDAVWRRFWRMLCGGERKPVGGLLGARLLHQEQDKGGDPLLGDPRGHWRRTHWPVLVTIFIIYVYEPSSSRCDTDNCNTMDPRRTPRTFERLKCRFDHSKLQCRKRMTNVTNVKQGINGSLDWINRQGVISEMSNEWERISKYRVVQIV